MENALIPNKESGCCDCLPEQNDHLKVKYGENYLVLMLCKGWSFFTDNVFLIFQCWTSACDNYFQIYQVKILIYILIVVTDKITKNCICFQMNLCILQKKNVTQ